VPFFEKRDTEVYMTATPMANHNRPSRSKRLRKKLFLDEFATYGFELECLFKEDVPEKQLSQFVDKFFIEAIAAKQLAFGGGLSSKRLSGFICSHHRYGSTTEEDKNNLLTWLTSQPEVSKVEAGNIIDANYYN